MGYAILCGKWGGWGVVGRFSEFSTRILLAGPRGSYVEPFLRTQLNGFSVRVADSPDAIRRAISEGPRPDLSVIDLTWDDYRDGFNFDGLDALRMLQKRDHGARVVFAVRGHAGERDHVDEAAAKPHVAGFYLKEYGFDLLVQAIKSAAGGESLDGPDFPWCGNPRGVTPIYKYFDNGSKGRTAAQMAGAIASGRVMNTETLVTVTGIPKGTASRPQDYLGPLITERGEYPEQMRVKQGVVYRWCGEHARYILSWCRRNGLAGLAARVTE